MDTADYVQVKFINDTGEILYVSAIHNSDGASWHPLAVDNNTYTEDIDDITGDWSLNYDDDDDHDSYKTMNTNKTLVNGHLYTYTIEGTITANNRTVTMKRTTIE